MPLNILEVFQWGNLGGTVQGAPPKHIPRGAKNTLRRAAQKHLKGHHPKTPNREKNFRNRGHQTTAEHTGVIYFMTENALFQLRSGWESLCERLLGCSLATQMVKNNLQVGLDPVCRVYISVNIRVNIRVGGEENQ